MSQKVSTGILLIRTYFIIVVLSSISNLLMPDKSLSKVVYGSSFVLYLVTFLYLLLFSIAIYYFFKPQKKGWFFALGAVIFSTVLGVISMIYLQVNFANIQEAMRDFMYSRYTTMTYEKEVLFISRPALAFVGTVGLIFNGVVLYFVYRYRNYFFKK